MALVEASDSDIFGDPVIVNEDPDQDSDIDAMATLSPITPSSAVTVGAGGARVTTSAAVTSTARAANPATPQTSVVRSSVVSSAAALPSTSTLAIPASPATSSSASPSTSALVRTSTIISSAVISSSSTSTTSSITRTVTSSSSSSASASSSRTSSSSASASASATAAAAGSKNGIAGTGLSLGALIGIIIGAVAGVVIIGMIVTRTIRKKQRRDRAKRRGSMFDWPTTGVEDEPFEKPRYEPPSQSYAMSDSYAHPAATQTVSYMTNETAYAPISSGAAGGSYATRHDDQSAYPAYPPQQQAHHQQQQYPAYPQNVVPSPNVPVPAGAGLHDGMWVRVKVGFVRSLEDELAIAPDQQLYLHSAYDDGWCLCEDANQIRGVVPLSCLEPWETATGMSRTGSGGSTGVVGERLQRRSSLYRQK
ncbi:hypothetical protein IAU60_001251 [Kwoniella sp. DSM 27419]